MKYLPFIISAFYLTACTFNEPIKLDFPTVESFTITSTNLANASTITIDGKIKANDVQADEIFLRWDNFFKVSLNQYLPETFENVAQGSITANGQFNITFQVPQANNSPDNKSLVFAILIKSIGKDAFSEIYQYSTVTKNLEKVAFTD